MFFPNLHNKYVKKKPTAAISTYSDLSLCYTPSTSSL